MLDNPGLLSEVESKVKFLDQGMLCSCWMHSGGAWGPALDDDWAMGQRQGQRWGPGTAIPVSSHITNPFQTLHILKIDLLFKQKHKIGLP